MKNKPSGSFMFIAGISIGALIVSPLIEGTFDKKVESVKEWAGIGKKKGVKTLSKPYKTKNATLDYYIFMFGKTKGIKEYNKHLILHKRTQQAKRKIIFSTNNDDIYTVDNWGSFYDYSSYDNSNRANQLNPNNNAYWQSRGYNSRPGNWQNISGTYSSNAAMNNHANQMNPNNAAYHSSRGGK